MDKNYLRFLDFSAFVSILAVACYLVGRTYYSSYLFTFGLTPSDLDLEIRDYAIAAIWPLVFISAFFFHAWNECGARKENGRLEAAITWMFFACGVGPACLSFGYNWDQVGFILFIIVCVVLFTIGAVTRTSVRQAFLDGPWPLRITALAVVCFSILVLAFSMGGEMSKKRLGKPGGYIQASTVTVTADTHVEYPDQLILVGQGKGFLYFVMRDEGKEPKVKMTFRVPVSSIASVRQQRVRLPE